MPDALEKKATSMMGKQGFTLSELMVVVAIIAIAAALVAPNLGGWLAMQKLKSATRTVISHLHQSRMEAIDRNHNVVIVFDLAEDTYRVGDASGDIVPTQQQVLTTGDLL